MTEAATEWRRSNEEARELLRSIPVNDWIRISYEDICTRTPETLEKVHDLLGLPKNDGYRNFRHAEHHVVGNGMRMDETSEISLDDRWRTHLAEPELREFDRIAGKLNSSLGYT
jgi:hypothetical protein